MKLITIVLVTLLLIELYRIYISNRQLKCNHKYCYIGTERNTHVYECILCSHDIISKME